MKAGGSDGLAGMVRLHRTLGDEDIGSLFECFTDEEFKFSGFVASSGEPGTVITFDPDFRTSEEITEPCHRMQWGRVVGQPNPWETVEIHFSRLFK